MDTKSQFPLGRIILLGIALSVAGCAALYRSGEAKAESRYSLVSVEADRSGESSIYVLDHGLTFADCEGALRGLAPKQGRVFAACHMQAHNGVAQ